MSYSCNDRQTGDTENALRIFDTFTGESKKTFSPSNQNSSGVHSWPFFKWSADEQFFGFCRPKGNNIFIYDTSTFMINSNKPIEIDGLVTFEWNPTKNLIAYYVEERVSKLLNRHIIQFFSHHRMHRLKLVLLSFHLVNEFALNESSPSLLQICFGKSLETIWLLILNATIRSVKLKKVLQS